MMIRSATLLKFPRHEAPDVASETEGGGGEDEWYRLVCSTEDCGSRHFWIEFSRDHDNKRINEVRYQCANCGQPVSLPGEEG